MNEAFRKHLAILHKTQACFPNSLSHLSAYAKAYGVSVDYLIGRTDNRAPMKSDNSDAKDAIRFALFDGANVNITDEMYEEIKRFAAFVANVK